MKCLGNLRLAKWSCVILSTFEAEYVLTYIHIILPGNWEKYSPVVMLGKKERCQWVFERENERFISLQHLVFSPTQVVIQTVTSLWKAFTETLMHLLLLNEFSDLCLVQKYPSIRHNISTNTTRTTTFLCKIMFNAVLPFCLSPWKKSVEAPKKQI